MSISNVDNINIYEDGTVETSGINGGKLKVLAIDNNYCILKESSYSQYVNRVSGVEYQCPQIYFYKILKIQNYGTFINLKLELIWCSETPKAMYSNFYKHILETYEELKYDPLAKYTESERKQIEEQLERQKRWMDELEKFSQNM